MPSLVQRFQNLFGIGQQAAQPVTLAAPPPRPSHLIERFSAAAGRRAMVEDARKMYADDPRADGSISTMARDATKSGFALDIDGPRADEAETIANELIDRLDIETRLDDWARLTARDGDTFLELGAAANGDIVHVSRKPALEMHRNSDDYDRFQNPEQAFYWSDKIWIADEMPPQDATWFAEWQIIHARYKRDEGSRYGRPLFASARGSYKRLNEGEIDISIRRKTRAGMKFHHVLEDAGEPEIEAYKLRNKEALDNPFAAVADFFTNKRGSITALQGDAHLSEIDDVLHHIDTWAISSPVPLELIGYGRNINRDVLEQKKEQYDDAITGVQGWLFSELIRPLIERQWLLRGILPDGLSWGVTWGKKSRLRPQETAQVVQAIIGLRTSGLVRDETLLVILASMIDGIDVQAEMEALAARMVDDAARVGGLV